MNLIRGKVHWIMENSDGSVAGEGEIKNIVTAVGERMYAGRGAGVSSPLATPTGMKLGTGTTSPSRTGAGSTIATYLTNSHQAFDSGYPATVSTEDGWSATYRCVFGPGKATTSGAITEAAIVNNTLANDAPTAAETVARVLLTGIPSKASDQTLTIDWSHTFIGG